MKLIELMLGFIFKVAFFLLELTVKVLSAIVSAIWSALMNRRAPEGPRKGAFTPRRRKYRGGRHARR